MSEGIAGKVIFVTGASSGIGAVSARALAEKGAIVAIAARRKDRLDNIVDNIVGNGGVAKAYELDVTNRAQVFAVVDSVVRDHGRIDVIINNAGLMPIRPMTEVNVDEWEAMIDVNLKGVLYGIAAALPKFMAQQSGHFINISSVAGDKVFAPGGTVYSGTKFAVSAISEGLRQEVGGNIRVTTISPGAVESDLKFGTTSSVRDDIIAFYDQSIPAEAVARSIAFAIEQPADVDVNEIVIRPTIQIF